MSETETNISYLWERLKQSEAMKGCLLTALEAVEWVFQWKDDGTWQHSWMECPWCRGHAADGHKSDCPRQAALKKAKGDA